MSTITVPGHRPQDAPRNVTKNVFTLSVITDYIIMFFCTTFAKALDYGDTFYLWEDCDREEFYSNQHNNHFTTLLGKKFACQQGGKACHRAR